MNKFLSALLIALLLASYPVLSQVVQVGSGSYTKTFPGVDVVGRNAYPSGSPQIIDSAILLHPGYECVSNRDLFDPCRK